LDFLDHREHTLLLILWRWRCGDVQANVHTDERTFQERPHMQPKLVNGPGLILKKNV